MFFTQLIEETNCNDDIPKFDIRVLTNRPNLQAYFLTEIDLNIHNSKNPNFYI